MTNSQTFSSPSYFFLSLRPNRGTGDVSPFLTCSGTCDRGPRTAGRSVGNQAVFSHERTLSLRPGDVAVAGASLFALYRHVASRDTSEGSYAHLSALREVFLRHALASVLLRSVPHRALPRPSCRPTLSPHRRRTGRPGLRRRRRPRACSSRDSGPTFPLKFWAATRL